MRRFAFVVCAVWAGGCAAELDTAPERLDLRVGATSVDGRYVDAERALEFASVEVAPGVFDVSIDGAGARVRGRVDDVRGTGDIVVHLLPGDALDLQVNVGEFPVKDTPPPRPPTGSPGEVDPGAFEVASTDRGGFEIAFLMPEGERPRVPAPRGHRLGGFEIALTDAEERPGDTPAGDALLRVVGAVQGT
jgi:hypothetical protein